MSASWYKTITALVRDVPVIYVQNVSLIKLNTPSKHENELLSSILTLIVIDDNFAILLLTVYTQLNYTVIDN